MKDSKTIKTITNFYSLLEKDHILSNEERDFITNIELELAKSLIEDLNELSARKLGHILIAATTEYATTYNHNGCI